MWQLESRVVTSSIKTRWPGRPLGAKRPRAWKSCVWPPWHHTPLKTFLVQPASPRKTLISVRSVSNELTLLDAPLLPRTGSFLRRSPARPSASFRSSLSLGRRVRSRGKRAKRKGSPENDHRPFSPPRVARLEERGCSCLSSSSLGGLEDVELPENRGIAMEGSQFLKCVSFFKCQWQCVADSKIFLSRLGGRGSFVDFQGTTSFNLANLSGDFWETLRLFWQKFLII